MITPEKILSILRMRGPSFPVQIKKALGEGDTMIIGALLTDLTRKGAVKITHMKRGGSPYYFIPEHKAQLVTVMDALGEKDLRTARRLQEEKVMRDKDQDPLTRVSLRQIKDFSRLVEVKRNGETDLFWKWYLLPNDQTEQLVKKKLGIKEKPAAVETPKETPAQVAEPLPQSEHGNQESDTKSAEEVSEEIIKPHVTEPSPQKVEENKSKKKELIEQKTLAENTPVAASRIDADGDTFLQNILDYFAEKHIQVISKEIVRKNREIMFEVSLPSAVGRVEYFVLARNKKKCNDGDLSAAYVEGQMKKLPVIFVTTGDLTKKARDMIGKKFKGLVLVEL